MKGPALATVLGILLIAVPCYAQFRPDPTDQDADGIPGVAEVPVGASQGPEVFAVSRGGRLLIDRSHGEDFNVSGFTGFLESQSWLVSSLLTGPITEPVISGCDVLMIPVRLLYGVVPFSSGEVSAVNAFVSNGGGLWLFHDYEIDASGINSLSNAFGVQFYPDILSDSTNNEGSVFKPTIHLLANHQIAQGVTSYGYYGGCCLSVSLPSAEIANGDDDASSVACASFPPTLAVRESSGRVVFAGDITPLHPNYYPAILRDEEELLLQNTANWLAHKPTTSAQPTTWGGIKTFFGSR